ncbi:MAG: hypothetical protein ACOZE5_11360 [Verrucomicrobiota bacterium]
MAILANVSFGIYAFMPLGWVFMAAIVLLEISLISRLLGGVWWKKEFMWPVIVANAVSGVIGFAVSLFMNGGWWLVVWMPWVSPNEVDLAKQFTVISIYYAGAFLISVVAESVIEQLMLRGRAGKKKVWLACAFSNIASYVLGGAVLYSWSFGLWR